MPEEPPPSPSPPHPAIDRLRPVFIAEDARAAWTARLPASDLAVVRAAAASAAAWRDLLLCAPDHPHHAIAARLRPHLALAAVHALARAAAAPPLVPDDPRYEPDPGPPLAHSPDTRAYRLLGVDPPSPAKPTADPPASQPSASDAAAKAKAGTAGTAPSPADLARLRAACTGLLAPRESADASTTSATATATANSTPSTSAALTTPYAQVAPDASLRRPPLPRATVPPAPVFSAPHAQDAQERKPSTLISILGSDSFAARNAVAMHHLRVLRHRAQDAIRERVAQSKPHSSPAVAGASSPGAVAATPAVATAAAAAASPAAAATPTAATPSPTSKPKPEPKLASASVTASPATPSPPARQTVEPDVLYIPNAVPPFPPDENESLFQAQMHAATALVVAQAGFTDSSARAIDILTDVAAHFLERIGRALSGCRTVTEDAGPVPRDEFGLPARSPDQFIDEMQRVCSSGFRGGFHELITHTRVDMPRTEQLIREAERKIRDQVQIHFRQVAAANARAPSPSQPYQAKKAASPGAKADPDPKQKPSVPGKEEPQIGKEANIQSPDEMTPSRDPVALDSDAFAFGFLNRSVCLDVLNNVRVPRKIAFQETGSKNGSPPNVKKSRSHRAGKQKESLLPAASRNPPTPVKAEATPVDMGD